MLKEQLHADMKAALRDKQADRLAAIRMLLAAIKQKEVDERVVLDDATILPLIDKQIKQRRDSIAQFAAAKRDDLVRKEQAELEVLQAYMPQQLSEAEVQQAVHAAIASTGAKSAADMGKVMAVLKPQLAGKTDMSKVSALLKNALSSLS